MQVGANYLGAGRCEFVVWAPLRQQVELKLVSPPARLIPLLPVAPGYWRAIVDEVYPGTKYFYRLDGDLERPDPASNYQPEGVHGPSEVIEHQSFNWQDQCWPSLSLADMVIYELHIGCFTPEGTFAAVIPRLAELIELGVNTIEIMPVAQFPGERNWGYDGTYLYAVQNSYGGPPGLKHLVDACHQQGLAVILDVVYNHLGPEGNYLWDYGPYFTDRYKTLWGPAVNFDGPQSDAVRKFFIDNALYWFRNYHFDALRIDAIHGIYDMSAKHFLQELAETVAHYAEHAKRRCYLIAESDLNDARVVRARELGGYGLHGQWHDDYHHCLHTLLTGEHQGYYADFGQIAHLVKALKEGFVYSGQYSQYRQRRHGNSAKDIPAQRLVAFVQNHDQVGNRLRGDRLSTLVPFEALKLAAGAVIFSPFMPLLFMGEEYGEQAPFQYFVSHSDPELIAAVRHGRKAEFQSFHWPGEPPDPQSPETFRDSKLRWESRTTGQHQILLKFYQKLLRLRRELPALARPDHHNLEVLGLEAIKVLIMRRGQPEIDDQLLVICNFNHYAVTLDLTPWLPAGKWHKVLDSADPIWQGPGSRAPEQLDQPQPITLTGLSFVAYGTSFP
ncbi:MAG: malto-oligosyltrehalose trehalohydrolase [Desulfobacca sp. 4484_104]|nr:MAG: malto-oligosyltrehalose trehalohydrolase [Desulfobacca sp. 4484_104]